MEFFRTYKRVISVVALVIALVGISSLVLIDKQRRMEQSKNLRVKLQEFLPVEAKNKVYVNYDLKTTKDPSISVVFSVSQDREKAIEGIIVDFVSQSRDYLKANDIAYSAITITVLTLKDYNQYRLVVGSEALAAIGETKDLLKDLTLYCPKTNPEKITEFCNLTHNLRK